MGFYRLCWGRGVDPAPGYRAVRDAHRREAAAAGENACMLDLCSGSGIIALAAALHCPKAKVTAVELSDAALPYLRRNNERHGERCTIVQADVLTWHETQPSAAWDVIASNPPYVTEEEYQTL